MLYSCLLHFFVEEKPENMQIVLYFNLIQDSFEFSVALPFTLRSFTTFIICIDGPFLVQVYIFFDICI